MQALLPSDDDALLAFADALLQGGMATSQQQAEYLARIMLAEDDLSRDARVVLCMLVREHGPSLDELTDKQIAAACKAYADSFYARVLAVSEPAGRA